LLEAKDLMCHYGSVALGVRALPPAAPWDGWGFKFVTRGSLAGKGAVARAGLTEAARRALYCRHVLALRQAGCTPYLAEQAARHALGREAGPYARILARVFAKKLPPRPKTSAQWDATFGLLLAGLPLDVRLAACDIAKSCYVNEYESHAHT
jgi:hypothetical protein